MRIAPAIFASAMFLAWASVVAADPAMECSAAASSQVEAAECIAATGDRVDLSVQTALEFAIQSARDLDEVTGRAVSEPALVASQSAWNDYRDQHCAFVGTTYGGGSGTGIAVGSALPVIVPGQVALVVSATIFGLCVFMPPGAVTSFSRQNLPPESWGTSISFFTVVFAVAQTIGPYGAGLAGDYFGNIGVSLLAAAGILLIGAGFALLQRPLPES